MTPQQETLRDHFLDHGHITQMEALINYGIGSLSSRISELARLGYVFEKEYKRDAAGKKYVRYRHTGYTPDYGRALQAA